MYSLDEYYRLFSNLAPYITSNPLPPWDIGGFPMTPTTSETTTPGAAAREARGSVRLRCHRRH